MAINNSKTNIWLRCLVSFFPAAGLAALLCMFLEGPRLGPLYDFLLRNRPALPVSAELLVIDSSVRENELGDGILEPGAAASLLYTLTELGARTLIIQVPILGLSAGGTVGETEILYRFDEEFSILSSNIRNLFDAIRTGSVAPGESARYVGELVELSEMGKERLVSALLRRDEEGIISMERAAAFFGHARRPGDLQIQLIRSGESGRPGVLADSGEYSRARPDRDGVLRRVSPILTVPVLFEGIAGERTFEHIIYGALKTRYESSLVEYTESGPVLIARNGPAGYDLSIPLDRSGAVIFELPRKGDGFRRISISDFMAYDKANRDLRILLHEAENVKLYSGIEGEDHPGILYDYALYLRDEPASSFSSDEQKRLIWIEARNRYFRSLEDFLSGPAERYFIDGFEEIGDVESRDSMIQTFAVLREKCEDVVELRRKLESASASSFCILGNTADAEVSALLANSILTGRVVKPGNNRYLLFGSLAAVLITCLFIKSLGLLATLAIGSLFTLFFAAGLSLGFIISGFWFDPIVPAAACLLSVLISFFWELVSRSRYNRQFRLAFGPFISRSCLRSVIREGKPLPSQILNARAAVVAVKNEDIDVSADSRFSSSQEVLAFQKKASEIFIPAGGTMTGVERDLATVCFGSPLERIHLKSQAKASPYENNIHALSAPAMRALGVISEIARLPECASWQFGIDIGNCTFAWTGLSGYLALGAPVYQARTFSRLTARYKCRIIISASVSDALPDLVVKKLGLFKRLDGSGSEAFYRVAVKGL